MASINVHTSQDGVKTYHVRVRRKGEPTQCAVFPTLAQARKFATMVEGRIIEGKHFPHKKTQYTLNELLDKYCQDVMPHKTAETQRSHRAAIAYWRERLGHKMLGNITRDDVIKGRDALNDRAPATVVKYMTILTHALNIAVKEYEWVEKNVASTVSRPPLPPGRNRFLTDEERSRLLEECRKSKNRFLYSLVVLALSSSLRRSSLLNIQKQNIELNKRLLFIPMTKNKTPLALPLVGEAYDIIQDLCAGKTDEEYIFPGHEKGNGGWNHYAAAFEYAVSRANLSDVTFHTLRHSCASYLVQAGIPLYVISQILGHKTLAMTARYSHLAVDNLRDALTALSQRLSQ